MATRVGLRPATIAITIIASLAAAPAASAAIKAYAPPIVLPGDASAAAVTSDPHNWLLSAKAGADSNVVPLTVAK